MTQGSFVLRIVRKITIKQMFIFFRAGDVPGQLKAISTFAQLSGI
jgi:hypothetical protein